MLSRRKDKKEKRNRAMFVSATTLLALSAVVAAHGDHNQSPIAGPHKELWYNTLPGDGGTQVYLSSPLAKSIQSIDNNGV